MSQIQVGQKLRQDIAGNQVKVNVNQIVEQTLIDLVWMVVMPTKIFHISFP